jgi:hypothetical protein
MAVLCTLSVMPHGAKEQGNGNQEGRLFPVDIQKQKMPFVGLGIQFFFLKFRFGFSVLKNFGFLNIRNQSVF